jgi:hypothetical protein
MRNECIVLILLTVLMALATPVLAAKPELHRATGGGTVMDSYYDPVHINTYAFTVQQLDEEGHARGNFVVHLRSKVYPTHTMRADLMYMAVVDNMAWMSGVWTYDSRDLDRVGKSFFVFVIDNGEGIRASGPDIVSSIVTGGDTDLAIDVVNRTRIGDGASRIKLTNGNIQIM